MRVVLADPTGQIERECAIKQLRMKDVALTYALAIRDEKLSPVDWKRANEAITKRWGPRGLVRMKNLAWKHFPDGDDVTAGTLDSPAPLPPCGKPCICSRGGCWHLPPPGSP